MIQEFYGLDLDAFSLSPDLDFLFLSHVHEEAVAHLLYGLEQNEDIILIVGDIGTGKTLTMHRVITQISSAFIPVSINVTTMDFEQLLRLALLKIGCDAKSDASLAFLIDAFEKQLVSTRDQGKKILLIVDEAQNLSVEVLESLRLLLNLAQPGGQALQLVLAGQLGLRANMNRPEMRQLRQRIRVDYEFGFLNREEVEDYILHRLRTAGRTEPLFEAKALDRIFHLSQGVPRVVNILASKALLAGFVEESKKIKSKHLDDIPLDDLLDTPAPKEIPIIGGAKIAAPEVYEPEETEPEEAAPEGFKVEVVEPEVAEVFFREPEDAPAPVSIPAPAPAPAPTPNPNPAPTPAPEAPAAQRRGGIGRGWLIAAVLFLAIIAAAVSYPIWGPLVGMGPADGAAVSSTPAKIEIPDSGSPIKQEPVVAVVEGASDSQEKTEAPVELKSEPEVTVPEEKPDPPVQVASEPEEEYLLHVASFAQEERGVNFANQLKAKGVNAFAHSYLNDRDKVWYRVYVGPYPTQQEATEVATTFKENGWIQFCRITTPDPKWKTE